MFDKISTALVNLLTSNTKIQKIYDYEASNIEGFPCAVVIPSANESAYTSTSENRRTYAYLIRIYNERGSLADDEKTCEKAMRDFVDSVLDAVDKSFSSFSPGAVTGYQFLFLSAAPSQWGYVGRENEMRVAEVKVFVHFDIDTNLIT
jgi:hypothetical protein